MNLFITETDSQRINGYLGEGSGAGTDWKFGMDMYTLLYLK